MAEAVEVVSETDIFRCEICDVLFDTKSELTSHKRNSHKAIGAALTATDRKTFVDFIKKREESALRVVEEGMSDRTEEWKASILVEGGFETPSKDLAEQIGESQEELKRVVASNLSIAKAQIEAEMTAISEETEKVLNDLRVSYKQQVTDIETQRDNAKRAKRESIVELETRIIQEKAPDLSSKLERLRVKMAETKLAESQAELTVRRRKEVLAQCRVRLKMAVRAASQRANERLYSVDTRAEAMKILQQIPEPEEIIAGCHNIDGMNSMLNRLSPTLALPVPQEQPFSRNKIIDVESV